MRSASFVTAMAMAALAWGAVDARAEVRAGSAELELFGGVYFPDDDEVENDVTYGIRLGHNFSDQFGFQAALSRFQNDGVLKSLAAGYDYEAWLLDLSFVFHANPEDDHVFIFTTGLGAAFTDIDVGAASGDDDGLTAHVGIGGKFYAGEHVYLRLDTRGRWLEQQGDDAFDVEGTFSVGLTWGGY